MCVHPLASQQAFIEMEALVETGVCYVCLAGTDMHFSDDTGHGPGAAFKHSSQRCYRLSPDHTIDLDETFELRIDAAPPSPGLACLRISSKTSSAALQPVPAFL